MIKVGLTGSIATGKSYVCSVLQDEGCHVFDADQTAREVVAKGTDGLAEIVRAFGGGVLSPDGSLDRKALARVVFADEGKRLLLNSIVHPRVIEAQNAWLESVEAADPNGIAVIDAALMIESGGYKRFDKLIVVWCAPDIQLQRLRLRDSLSLEDAQRRIAAQMPQEEKKRYADHLIDTSGTFDEVRERTKSVLASIKKLRS